MVVFNYYYYLLTHMPTLLLLLLSRFSRVRLCATPWTAAHQASPSMILQARTLERVAISFSKAWKGKVKVKSLSRVRLLATPWTAAYLPGSSIHVIFQARILEWGAIAFSGSLSKTTNFPNNQSNLLFLYIFNNMTPNILQKKIWNIYSFKGRTDSMLELLL